MGLSLRLHTQIDQHEENREEMKAWVATDDMLHKSNLGGITSHTTSAMANRKARVSVRTRCQAPTVSSIKNNGFGTTQIWKKFEWYWKVFHRWMMDANGGNMGRRSRKETHAQEPTIDAQWHQDAQ